MHPEGSIGHQFNLETSLSPQLNPTSMSSASRTCCIVNLAIGLNDIKAGFRFPSIALDALLTQLIAAAGSL